MIESQTNLHGPGRKLESIRRSRPRTIYSARHSKSLSISLHYRSIATEMVLYPLVRRTILKRQIQVELSELNIRKSSAGGNHHRQNNVLLKIAND
jgi:hypothetical protein